MGPDRGEESRIPRHRCSATLLCLIGRARAHDEGVCASEAVRLFYEEQVNVRQSTLLCAHLIKPPCS